MSYKLIGAVALVGASGAAGLVVVNREKIFGKSKTLVDDLKEKGYRLVSGVSDVTKRKAVLDEKAKNYKASNDASQEFAGKNKDTMTSDALLDTCQGLEQSSDYEAVLSKFQKGCTLDFKDVLVTLGGRTVISDTNSGEQGKTVLGGNRADMKDVVDGISVSGDDGNSQWEKVKTWCEGQFKVQYSSEKKDDFDRVEKWCLTAKG